MKLRKLAKLAAKKIIPVQMQASAKMIDRENELLNDIAYLTSKDDADYYVSQLHSKFNTYDFSTYICLLEQVLDIIRKGYVNDREMVVRCARIKVFV